MAGAMIENHLSRILGERRMSIAALARSSGVSYTSLFELYHGRAKRVDLETLNAICRALSVQPGDILGYVPDPETPQ